MRFLLRTLALALLTVLATAALWPSLQAADAPPSLNLPPEVKRIAFTPLPPADAQAPQSILQRSPFVADRSAFNRDIAVVPPPPPPEVRLTGVFSLGGKLQASLWIDGRSVLVKQGDETPAGKVVEIDKSSVTLDGSPPRTLEIFRP